MNWNFSFRILLWFSFFYFIKGDECYSGNGDLMGTCKLLSECPSAEQMIRNHRTPTFCIYDDYEPTVCCPRTGNHSSTTEAIPDEAGMLTTQFSTDVPTTQTSSDVNTSASVSPLTEERTTRISEQECSSFQDVKLQQREKFDYRDAAQQKLENINNEIAEFPHTVVLGITIPGYEPVYVYEIIWKCGGSLISNKFVLTAAQCLYYTNLEWANMGNALLHTYSRLSDPEQMLYKIIRRIPHPRYKPPSFYHNIGLVELDRPVEFSLYTRPACLHVDQHIDPNTQLAAAGWRLEHFGKTKETLVKLENVHLDLFTEDECATTYKDLSGSGRLSTGIAHKEQFCVGARSDVTNTCKIFSGGALQFQVNSSSGASYIAGVNSFGNTCGLRGVPSVYTRVAAYVPWIESVVWPQSHDHMPTPQPIPDAFATLYLPQLTTSLSDDKCAYIKFGRLFAQEHEFPHMVALGSSSENNETEISWECEGALISQKFVLTSAFCLTRNVTWAIIGDNSRDKYLKLVYREQLIYKIIRQIPHPLYKAPAAYHDIALLELDSPVEFNRYTRPACLHDGQDLDSRTQFLATGWSGNISRYDYIPVTQIEERQYQFRQLHKINLNILSSDGCEGAFKSSYGSGKIPNGILHDYQFCAGGHIAVQDTCVAENGGPLQFKISNYTGNMWHVIGILSPGTACGRSGLPRVYTRVAAYVPWIESIVWPQSHPPAPHQVTHPALPRTPPTPTSLSTAKCLYFREAELKERFLIFKKHGDALGVGGYPAQPNEFPHMVALGYSNTTVSNDIAWLCGGSLVSEKFVLTAAHCLGITHSGNLTWALLGTSRTDAYLKPTDPEPLLRKVIRQIKHPMYKRSSKYHDIALVELDRPVTVFADNIRPACLYTEALEVEPKYKPLVGTGWGLTETGNVTIDLIRIDLSLFTDDECDATYEPWNGTRALKSGILHWNQFCAGGRHEIRDTCPGDSGGPIQFRDFEVYPKFLWKLVGVTSFGKSCGLRGVPGVYTRVAAYVLWIESIVWPDEYIHPDEPELIDSYRARPRVFGPPRGGFFRKPPPPPGFTPTEDTKI